MKEIKILRIFILHVFFLSLYGMDNSTLEETEIGNKLGMIEHKMWSGNPFFKEEIKEVFYLLKEKENIKQQESSLLEDKEKNTLSSLLERWEISLNEKTMGYHQENIKLFMNIMEEFAIENDIELSDLEFFFKTIYDIL